MSGTLWLLLGSLVGILATSGVYGRLADRRPGASGRRDRWEVIRAANLAGSSLRSGLTAETMQMVIGPLNALAATDALLMAGTDGGIVSHGLDEDHRRLLMNAVSVCLSSGRPVLLGRDELECGRAGCRLATAVVAPLHVDREVVGALVSVDSRGSRGMVQLTAELARYVSSQLERADAQREPARTAPATSLDVLTVDGPGRTVFVSRSEVAWVESAGDYVRVHTFDHRSLLARYSLTRLEEAWNIEGFARIHRQYLVCLRAVREIRRDGPHMSVALPDVELPVSRRHTRGLRDRLVGHAGSDGWPRTA